MQRAASTAAQRIGDDGEDLAAARLEAAGWTVLARNLRLGRDEVDLLGVDPGPPAALVSSRSAAADDGTSAWPRRRWTTASGRRSGARAAACWKPAGCRTDDASRHCRCGSTWWRSIRVPTGGRPSATIAASGPEVRAALAGPGGRAGVRRQGVSGGPVLHSRPPRHVRGGQSRPRRHRPDGAHTRITTPHGTVPTDRPKARRHEAPAGDPRRHQPQEVTQCPPSRCASCLRPASTSDTRPAAGTRR